MPASKKPALKADGQNQMNSAAAEAQQVQSGQAQGPSPKERRAELNAQFEKADEKGKAAIIEETQAGLGIRGY